MANQMIFGTEKSTSLHGSWVFDRYLKRSAQYCNLSISQFCKMVCPDCKLEKRTRVVHVHVDGGNYGCELHIPAGVSIQKYVESFIGFLGHKVEIHPDDVIDVYTEERSRTSLHEVGNVRLHGSSDFVGDRAIDFSRAHGVGGDMPKLIPISEVAGVPMRVGADIPKLIPISEVAEVPTRVGVDIPKLIPISEIPVHVGVDIPKLIPISEIPVHVGVDMPKLIPISEVAGAPMRGDMPKLMPIQEVVRKPKLIPIPEETPKLVPIPSSAMPTLEPIPVGDLIPKLVPLHDDVPNLVPIGNSRSERLTLVNFSNAIKSFTGAIASKVGTPPGFDLRDKTKRRVVFAYSDSAFGIKIGSQSLKEYLIAKSKISGQEYAAALYSLFVDTVADRPDEWKDGMSFYDYVERHGILSTSAKNIRSVEFRATSGDNRFVLRVNSDTREIDVITRVATFSSTSLDYIVPAGPDYPTVVLFKMEKPFGGQ